jgi:hypothetical protein
MAELSSRLVSSIQLIDASLDSFNVESAVARLDSPRLETRQALSNAEGEDNCNGVLGTWRLCHCDLPKITSLSCDLPEHHNFDRIPIIRTTSYFCSAHCQNVSITQWMAIETRMHCMPCSNEEPSLKVVSNLTAGLKNWWLFLSILNPPGICLVFHGRFRSS